MRISPRLRWLQQTISGNRILDIGFAGENEPLAHRLIRQRCPASLVAGVDINQAALRRYRFANSACGDATRLPFASNSFDTVTLLEVIEHFDQRVFSIVEEAGRVLEPCGKLILTTPNPLSWYSLWKYWLLPGRLAKPSVYRGALGNPDHKMFWDPHSLMSILDRRGFGILSITTRNHRVPLISRIIRPLGAIHIPFYPFTRLGSYTCLVAEKRA